MAKIIKINNPITNTGKEIIITSLKKPIKLYSLLKRYGFVDAHKYIVIIDGKPIYSKNKWRTITITNDDIINIVPHIAGGGKKGKRILSLIGAIALSVASAGAGAAFKSAATGAWTTASYVAAAVVSFVGGLIIQKLTPKPKVEQPREEEQRAYSWQLGGLNTTQGGGVPVIYGTVRPTLTVLSQHTVSQDDKSYIQLLLCPCEGPIDEIRDIRINKNPIENYKDVVVETRLGTNVQLYIPNIGDTYADQSLGYELNESWRTAITEGDAGEGLEITVEFPAGLYYSNDAGGASTASVSIAAEIKKEDTDSWITWGAWTISEAKTVSFRRVYTLNNLKSGRYEVRVRRTWRSGSSLRDINKCYWSQLSHIIYKFFDRPGKALIAIKALATDQLSGGMPEVTCEVVRSSVWVYNPYTLLYEKKPADNPAWASYDIWHRCELLEHPETGELRFSRRGVPKEYMIYDDFKAWADKCDQQNLKVNIAINSAGRKTDKLNDVGLCGRGTTLTRGTKIGCVFDTASEMTQIFNVGNILEGSFKENFLSLTDRANIIELSYYDKERNYQQETVRCYATGWEKIKGINNPSQIRYDGITDKNQAWREAAYQARKNKYEIRMVAIGVKYEAIACQVGDVIGIQHDIPSWGYGGRVVAFDKTKVKLDRLVVLEKDVNYEILFRMQNDDMYNYSFAGTGEETDEIVFNQAIEANIKPLDLWVLGEIGKVIKPFRVLNITRSGISWTERTIWCMEYIKEVYDEDEDVPDIDYAITTSPIRGLMATRIVDLNGICYIELTWLSPRKQHTKIKVFVNDTIIAELAGDSTSYRLEPNKWGELTYKVDAVDYFGNSTSSSFCIYDTKPPLPPNLPSFYVTFLATIKQFAYEWNVPDDPMPIDGYEIRRGQTFAAGQTVKFTPGRAVIRDTGLAIRGKSTFWIAAKNRYGYSENPLQFDINVEEMPSRDVIMTIHDYEETGTVEGNGEIVGGVLIQHSGLTVGQIKIMTWGELKDIDWLQGAYGKVTATGKIIDLGKIAEVTVWINEIFIQAPDASNLWEYKTSFDNIIWSDWSILPIDQPIDGQYFCFRVTMQGIAKAGMLQDATIMLDVPENTIKLPAVAIPTAGKYINFNPKFINPPTIQITPNNEKLIIKKTNITGDGCFVQLFEAYNDAPVEGIADIFATGF